MRKEMIIAFFIPLCINARLPEGIHHPKPVETYSFKDHFYLFPEKKEVISAAYEDESGRYPEAVFLAKQLYQAQREKNPERFFSVLRQARQQFSSNPDALLTFFMTRNEYGFTALMVAAVTGDIVQLAALLRIVKTAFGNNHKAAFTYLNAQEPQSGYTALLLATDVGTLKVVKEIMDGASLILKGNKPLFLKFLNTSDFIRYQNPLNNLAFDSSSSALRYLVYKASEFFGQSSEEFDKFINWTDTNGLTALQYALLAEDRNFLIQNGAIIRKVEEKKIEDARKFGKQLIDMVHFNELAKVKKILYEAEKRYKNNTILFLDFISERDDAGWLALTHSVAQGKMVYVKLIIYAIESLLKKDPIDIYNILANVDYTGKNILTIALQRENFNIARYIIEKTIQYVPNKYLFFDFINNQNVSNGFAPLATLVYRSSDVETFSDMVKFLLDTMAAIFDKNSRQFDLFINLLDWNHYTALDYANTPVIQDLLKDYGAKMGRHVFEQRSFELQRARNL